MRSRRTQDRQPTRDQVRRVRDLIWSGMNLPTSWKESVVGVDYSASLAVGYAMSMEDILRRYSVVPITEDAVSGEYEEPEWPMPTQEVLDGPMPEGHDHSHYDAECDYSTVEEILEKDDDGPWPAQVVFNGRRMFLNDVPMYVAHVTGCQYDINEDYSGYFGGPGAEERMQRHVIFSYVDTARTNGEQPDRPDLPTGHGFGRMSVGDGISIGRLMLLSPFLDKLGLDLTAAGLDLSETPPGVHLMESVG